MKPLVDSKGRLRNKTIAFRASESEYAQIQMLSDVSGMKKQDYLLSRALGKEIVVHPNVRVKKFLEQYLSEIHEELLRVIAVSGEEDVIEKLSAILSVIEKL